MANNGLFGFPPGPQSQSGLPVGSIIYSVHGINDPAYLPADGRSILRSQYPLYSRTTPVPVFTETYRTKVQDPISFQNSTALCSHGANWIMAGGATTYYTSDGVTFTAAGGSTIGPNSLVSDGVNVVAISSTAKYSTDSGVNWQASTGGVGAHSQSSVAHAPQLGTVGRFAVADVNSGGITTSDDRGLNFVAQGTLPQGNSWHIAWTGSVFVAISSTQNVVFTSPTGLSGSWTTVPANFYRSNNPVESSIASNGNGLVIVTSDRSIATSRDHGQTWTQRQFSNVFMAYPASEPSYLKIGPVSFTNGLFFFNASHGALNVMMTSSNLVDWVAVPNSLQAANATQRLVAMSFKSGVYFGGFDAGTTNAVTMTEDKSRAYLPNFSQPISVTTTGTQNIGSTGFNTTAYVKVA